MLTAAFRGMIYILQIKKTRLWGDSEICCGQARIFFSDNAPCLSVPASWLLFFRESVGMSYGIRILEQPVWFCYHDSFFGPTVRLQGVNYKPLRVRPKHVSFFFSWPAVRSLNLKVARERFKQDYRVHSAPCASGKKLIRREETKENQVKWTRAGDIFPYLGYLPCAKKWAKCSTSS